MDASSFRRFCFHVSRAAHIYELNLVATRQQEMLQANVPQCIACKKINW